MMYLLLFAASDVRQTTYLSGLGSVILFIINLMVF
jgi:hypothetical protein